MGGGIPKQFLPLDGRAIILRTMGIFHQHEGIDQICVVCGEEWSGRLKYLIEQENLHKVCSVVDGGKDRRESAFRGLSALMEQFSPEDTVLIHDAARPLVSHRMISDSIACAKRFHACTAVLPVEDTILDSGDGRNASKVPERARLYTVQTPQGFRLGTIYEAHKRLPESVVVTDDAGILVAQGTNVKLVRGEKRNLKITSPEDIAIAESYLKMEKEMPLE